jgi:hypothetical protein
MVAETMVNCGYCITDIKCSASVVVVVVVVVAAAAVATILGKVYL